ncbi:MAG TPA: hypothetical protein VFC78_06290 [Tepidisphaeraceae bacterium]|nr:hypothetical protein [Tepidisphaeraceae bacterium]
MQDQPQKRSLSEISHLFLSSVREKQTNGAPRPRRIPPGGQRNPADAVTQPANAGNAMNTTNSAKDAFKDNVSIDLTPEEFAQVFGDPGRAIEPAAPAAPEKRATPVTAILGAHLNGRQFERVKEYARHLAMIHGRIGLIELDASEFRLMSFEVGNAVLDPDLDQPESHECYDVRQMAQALEEMNCDVDRWLLLVSSPRTPEAKALLRCVNHWVLLSTCDHDGVVSSYRMLKGMAESYRPRLSLALLDGADAQEAGRVYRKVSSVCRQFLDWPLEDEPIIRKTGRVTETLVLSCRPTRDKAQLAAAPQWQIVADFLQSQAALPAPQAQPGQLARELAAGMEAAEDTIHAESQRRVADIGAPTPSAAGDFPESTVCEMPEPQANDDYDALPPATIPMPRVSPPTAGTRDTSVEVMDLPGPNASAETILGAIIGQTSGALIECPVRAPMCAQARLAVTRDRDLVLLAVAREGLTELRAIGQAYRWLIENRALIGMAMPQLAIDPARTPRLRLLVDQADLSADVLQPMLQSENVTVQAYRKLRWGGKTGLFLEAA